MQVKSKLRPYVIPTLYGIVTISLLVSLMFLVNTLTDVNNIPINYITASTIAEDITPVVGVKKVVIKPYIDEDVKILQNFYDYKGNKETQENSLIYYENTYLQNSGIDYGKEESFDIVSILNGTVVDIIEDNVLGKIVQIQHTNDVIGSYQCLNEITISKNDTVSQGQKIGTSGTCNIAKELGNHLHFEVTSKGEIINPETIYDKNINEI